MIESSLSKLEQLVSDLVQQKQELLDTNAALNVMEQEEKQGATAARIQALVERASPVSA